MNAIPYAIERRPDTGVNNVKLGVWLFLAWEGMLFAALFSAYFMLRAGAITWGWSPHWELARANTVLLLGSTGVLSLAMRAARRQRVTTFRAWMSVSLVLATAFLGVKTYEYRDDFALALYPRVSTRIALYYLLTGIHALHVVGGLIVDVWLIVASGETWRRAAPVMINRVEATTQFWVFVDVIWLILLLLLYVW